MDERFLLDTALSILTSNGAEGDVFLESRRNLQFQIREGEVRDLSRADVRGMGVRAMREGRLGFVHTSALDPDGVRRAAERALDLSRSANPREDLHLPDPAGPGDGRDEGEGLGLHDPTIGTRSIREKQEWARAAEAVARGYDARITRTEGASYSETLTSAWISNTKGLHRHLRKSYLEVGLQVIAEEGGELQPGELGFDAVRWDGLPDPGDLGRRAGERAIRLLGGRPVSTGRYPVVFAPEAGWALLIYLSVALRGDHLSRRRSWLAEREGTTIGSPLVTVRDDGRKRGGMASLPFDGEGVDTQETVLLDKGQVRGKLLDLAAAKRMGLKSTGSSRRGGYEGLPAIASSNLYLEPGATTREQLLEGVDAGLWVWGLSGWWIGLDPTNPSFSSAAFGLWIEKGKPVRPVARVTVAGTIEEILGGVDAVADDLVWDHAVKTPTFRVRDLAVSGI